MAVSSGQTNPNAAYPMAYLFCQKHGPNQEAGTIAMQDELCQEGECVVVVEGTLNSGPWRCDSCNAVLNIGDRAWLKSAFPHHLYDNLVDYDFSYELHYFAMTPGDRVASYGLEWPDDSLQPYRIAALLQEERPPKPCPMSAMELFGNVNG